MIKKGRENNTSEVINLSSTANTIADKISVKTNTHSTDGVTVNQYHILPKYGNGCINHFITEDIDICISRYQLHNDLTYSQPFEKEIMQISFLLMGEKIIYIEDEKQIFYENRESYMASIDQFTGYSRILGGKQFKEVKIKLPKSFLISHGFMNDYDFKKLTDENLILPITDELLSILLHIERKDITGTANRMYLRAKVFELIAIQMEHYKNSNNTTPQLSQDKTLKKLYLVKQLVKANIHKNITLSNLGNELGITGHTLNKEFIRIFGCSINEYSTTEKMNQAKMMLENSQKMVYQIAEEVGYKKKFGTTPKQYRKLL